MGDLSPWLRPSVTHLFTLTTFQRALTGVGAVCCSAVRIGRSRLLDFRHSPPLLLPHLHFRLGGSGTHIRYVSLLAFSAVPVRSPLPVLDSLFTKTPVSRAASGWAFVTPLIQPALHVIVLSFRTVLHGMHLNAITVVTSRALRDRLDPPWCSAEKKIQGRVIYMSLFLLNCLTYRWPILHLKTRLTVVIILNKNYTLENSFAGFHAET